jgi:deoxyribonuclease-1-like protein
MQRLLSLATLGVLGGLVWMFLSGGGLDQLAVDAPVPATGVGAQAGFPGAWPTQPQAGGPAFTQPTAGANVPPLFDGPKIRIASFNIQDFGPTKAGKREVWVTLAEIIRRFDVVAIQEISSKDQSLMRNFLAAVNGPGRAYDIVLGPRLGNSNQMEQYAYLYDTSRIIVDPSTVYTVGDPENLLHREPLVATFRTRMPEETAFTFILVNVHTDPDVVFTRPTPGAMPGEIDVLAEVYRVVRQASQNEDDVIMLGDFNVDDRRLGRLGQIPGIKPLLLNVATNVRQDKMYDNIILHEPSTTEYAGVSGVFDIRRELGLTNLSQADLEQISDHLPVYAEFYATERDGMGRIAARRTMVR